MLSHHHHHHHSSTFTVHLPLPVPPLLQCSRTLLHTKPYSHFRISCSSNKFPRWDSNAETFRPRNFNFNNTKEQEQEFEKKRSWWSDDESPEFEEQNGGIWEEVIDGMWVLKVFKSYGWTLPIILGSWLFATGPKAFLMALAIPLGQSALAFTFEKLWGRSERKSKRKYRVRRKPRTASDTRVEEEPEENQKTGSGKTGYQSWVENNGSVDTGSREARSFGGWDDLERSRPTSRSSRTMGGSQKMPMEAGRLSRRGRKSETPLLLRLLISIFPFLGTWTKML